MEAFGDTEREFHRRVNEIPMLGLGLSVDVYSPDLLELMGRFEGRKSRPAYLEIFRAARAALQTVRQHAPAMPMAYHGEGLWVTQPGLQGNRAALGKTGEHDVAVRDAPFPFAVDQLSDLCL